MPHSTRKTLERNLRSHAFTVYQWERAVKFMWDIIGSAKPRILLSILLALHYREFSAKLGINVLNMGPRLITKREKRSLEVIIAASA